MVVFCRFKFQSRSTSPASNIGQLHLQLSFNYRTVGFVLMLRDVLIFLFCFTTATVKETVTVYIKEAAFQFVIWR